MTSNLSGKVALVAGGSRSIGAAIVRRLAREGAAVAFTYANADDRAAAVVAAVEAAGGKALAIKADSADPQASRDAVERTVATFGGLDILVNNAGIMMPGAEKDPDVGSFDRMIAVNVRAYWVFAQAAERHMKSGSRIIVIGSNAAQTVRFPGATFYTMTKAAVAGLTRGLARDLGARGITVNTVQPGPTETDLIPGDGAIAERVRPLIAVGRMGKDEEIASFVAYLAGPEAGYITGASLTIDGGYTA